MRNEERTLAPARTLTVLSRLDGGRKATVVQFLYELGLVGWIKSSKIMEKYGCIVDLRDANLRGAVLVEAVLTAGCNEVDPSGLLFGVPHLKGIIIFCVGLLKKHPCTREVAWSNITAKRC